MIVHSILSHHPAKAVDAMAEFLQALGNDVRFRFAYGGERDEFEKIRSRDKIFLADPGLRGKIESRNFSNWFKAGLSWFDSAGLRPDYIHFTECDHLPLQAGYWSQIEKSMLSSGKDFLGKWCMDRSNTNEQFYLKYRGDPALLRHLRSLNPTLAQPVIWGALADGMTFRAESLRALCGVDLGIDCFTEILIPSTLHQLGRELGDFDAFSTIFACVRHRPEFLLSDVSDLLARGAWCCHPFKNVIQLPDLYDLVLQNRGL